MNRRLIKPLAYFLVAAQLLLLAPVASALVTSGAAANTAHCAEMAPPGGTEPCPCCPEGTDMTSCLASCTATPCTMQMKMLPRVQTSIARPAARIVLHLANLADPPLKPPPIV